MSSDRTAVFPGTFDPFTNGHLDLTRRAARLFDRVVVAVAESPSKGALFPMTERLEMIRVATRGLKTVEVVDFSDLVVDCARRVGAAVMIRGLRAVSDFEFEFQMALMNRRLSPALEVAFLMPSQQYTYLNSTLVKEVARLGGSVKGLVPQVVEDGLRVRLGLPKPSRAAAGEATPAQAEGEAGDEGSPSRSRSRAKAAPRGRVAPRAGARPRPGAVLREEAEAGDEAETMDEAVTSEKVAPSAAGAKRKGAARREEAEAGDEAETMDAAVTSGKVAARAAGAKRKGTARRAGAAPRAGARPRSGAAPVAEALPLAKSAPPKRGVPAKAAAPRKGAATKKGAAPERVAGSRRRAAAPATVTPRPGAATRRRARA